MSDDVDATEEEIEFSNAIAIKNVCAKASKIPIGEAGQCDFCGENFSRVIEVNFHGNNFKSCGRCRDKLKLD